MDSKKYKAVRGAIISDDQAQAYGERIAQLELEHRDSGYLPDILIEDGRHSDSPLNEYFDWDNEVASLKWRRHQAVNLLCWIEVEIINPTTEELEYTRAFHPVIIVQPTNEKDEKPEEIHVWTTKERILCEMELRRQIIEKALAQLESFRQKYKQYQELAPIFDAIEQIRLPLNNG